MIISHTTKEAARKRNKRKNLPLPAANSLKVKVAKNRVKSRFLRNQVMKKERRSHLLRKNLSKNKHQNKKTIRRATKALLVLKKKMGAKIILQTGQTKMTPMVNNKIRRKTEKNKAPKVMNKAVYKQVKTNRHYLINTNLRTKPVAKRNSILQMEKCH